MNFEGVSVRFRPFRLPAAAAAWLAVSVAHAGVDVALVPEQPALLVGDTLRVRIVLAADSPDVEPISSARILLEWDPARLQLLGVDDTNAVDLLTSGFPTDPSGVNESTLPQDGDALFLAFAPLMTPVLIDQEGSLFGTLVFECLAPGSASVDIVPTAGLPATTTAVFSADEPNLDVLGLYEGTTIGVLAEPTVLVLDVAPTGPVGVGDAVTVTLSMANLHGREAAGFQAFLEFDPAELTFITGSYTPAPFGSPLIDPIAIDGGSIDLAAGINVLAGQPPSSADALLATIAFVAARPGCVSSVHFRTGAVAESRLSDEVGLPIEPFALVDPPPGANCDCPCEIDGEAGIDVFDLLGYLDLWFAADAAAERTDDVPASIDVFDLLMYLDCWFAPPAGCA